MASPITVTKFVVEWMPFMASCHLSLFSEEKCTEGIAIRPNVPFEKSPPANWPSELTSFVDHAELTPAEASRLLVELGMPVWEEDIHNSMGTIELRGHTPTLKFWITCHAPNGLKQLTPEEHEDALSRLNHLKDTIWC